MSEEIRITVLSENTAARPDLRAEFGLSLWIEADGTKILFDTGQAGAFAVNAAALGIDLSSAVHLALSHGHFDHTGGIAQMLDISPELLVHVHPDAVSPKYLSLGNGRSMYIGMPEQSIHALKEKTSRCLFMEDVTRLTEHVFLTGEVPRASFEKIVEPFTLDAKGERPDPMTDDQALWIETSKGLVVVLGCAHSGVVNTVEHIREKSGRGDIRAVIGGMHLLNASTEAMEKTADRVASWHPELIAPNHCTGEAAISFFRKRFPDICRAGASGTVFSL